MRARFRALIPCSLVVSLAGATTPVLAQWAPVNPRTSAQTQAELLGIAKKYRDLRVPVDNIVQDWFWWNRKAEFAGMLRARTFHVVFVGANHGVGMDTEAKPDRVVKYSGKALT